MLSSHAKFDANGFGMLIRDLENLYLYVGGSNDIAQDSQQSVSQSNAQPLANAPVQQTGFDGIGGMGNLGQPALQQNAQASQTPVSYPIVPARGGTGLTTIPAHGVMVGEGTANVTTASPGTAGLSLVSNGASADPTFQAVPASGGITGVVQPVNGGTGVASPAAHGVVIAEGAFAMNVAAPGTAGLPLVSNGASADPSFQAITIASTTGTLAIARGGTASASALTASAVMVSNGSAIVQGPAGTTTTVLHGNASGLPAYSAVDLTADVTGILPIANGGTAGNTQATARTGLGLGTIATQNANNVTITGGYVGPLYFTNSVSFTSSGTWNVPAGVFAALVVTTGGGGGGGGSNTGVATGINLGGGGGASGTTSFGTLSVTPLAAITITIGAAGTAGAAGGGTGGTGGATLFGSTMSALGGGGGTGSSGGGLGGRPSNGFGFLSFQGQISIPGVQGENAYVNSASVSGGNVTLVGQGGGRGGTSVNSTGGTAGGGGAGRDGGTNTAGAAGQPGTVVIYY